MNEKDKKHIGKFISLVLRHKPETIGVQLDENGWATVDELIAGCAKKGVRFTKEQLDEIVATNNKQRYSFNADKTLIRANQGHSVEVDVELKSADPHEFLYHGTVAKFLDAILAEGLKKMSRQHVHLSRDQQTAFNVGSRRGKAVILKVRAAEMAAAGHTFYLSENGVWLCDAVPAQYIDILEGHA